MIMLKIISGIFFPTQTAMGLSYSCYVIWCWFRHRSSKVACQVKPVIFSIDIGTCLFLKAGTIQHTGISPEQSRAIQCSLSTWQISNSAAERNPLSSFVRVYHKTPLVVANQLMLKESENIEGEKIEQSEGRYSNSLLGNPGIPRS